MAKSRKRMSKAVVKNNFITYNLKMVQMIFVLILALFLVEYLNTQPITDQAIAGELKGGTVCTDSDGPNYYNYGYVTYKNYRYYDNCIDTQRVSESICSNKKYRAVLYTCPYGCSGGKCNSKPTTSTTTTTVPPANCYDSDGGINYYVKGTATDNSISRTDTCYDPAMGVLDTCSGGNCTVEEFYCGPDNKVYLNLNYNACPHGCVKGACIPCSCTEADLNSDSIIDYRDLAICGARNVTGNCDICIGYWYGKNCSTTTTTTSITTTTTVMTCIDTDGGINYYVKGTTVSKYGNYTDYCWVDSDGLTKWLREYYCDSSGTLYTSDVSCTWYGYDDCQDGACFYEPETTTTTSIATTTTIPNLCSDTDDGIVITTRGVTYGYYSGSWYNYTDYCGNISLVIEYYCIGNQVSNTIIDCYSVNSTSCSSGACVY